MSEPEKCPKCGAGVSAAVWCGVPLFECGRMVGGQGYGPGGDQECLRRQLAQEQEQRTFEMGVLRKAVDDMRRADERAEKAEAELAKSKLRECKDIALPDGRLMRFVTPETATELHRLQAENTRLREIAASVVAMLEHTGESQNFGELYRDCLDVAIAAAKEDKECGTNRS